MSTFTLYACCIPVKGASRSTICDLQRCDYELIPNGLYDILTTHASKSVDAIKAAYDNEYDDIIDEYFAFLEEKEYGFWTDEPERFPELDLTWERPEYITNAIIDVSADSTHDFADLVDQLDDLRCKSLQLRFLDEVSLNRVKKVLSFTDDSRLRSVEVMMPYPDGAAQDDVVELSYAHPRLGRVTLHDAPVDDVSTVPGLILIQRKQHVDAPSCCGQVHEGYFIAETETFAEAQEHNTCLNRKVSVDADGQIRNCPSLPMSYGDVNETSIHEAVMRRDFQELWEINKDQIDTCRDCEFRYICTDCRAFIDDEDDLYSKPSKCSYDPYTATWSA